MKAIDWSMCAREWPHLRCLEFHKLGPRPTVDVLIGLDCADLHFSFREPVAWLTQLGWTCIGPTRSNKQININTNFAHTQIWKRLIQCCKSFGRSILVEHVQNRSHC